MLPLLTRVFSAAGRQVVGTDNGSIRHRPLPEVNLAIPHHEMIRMVIAEGRQILNQVCDCPVRLNPGQGSAMGDEEAAFVPSEADQRTVEAFSDDLRLIAGS